MSDDSVATEAAKPGSTAAGAFNKLKEKMRWAGSQDMVLKVTASGNAIIRHEPKEIDVTQHGVDNEVAVDPDNVEFMGNGNRISDSDKMTEAGGESTTGEFVQKRGGTTDHKSKLFFLILRVSLSHFL